jgi:biopolymer transport protein ExbB
MAHLSSLVDYGVIGILVLLSMWAAAITVERLSLYRRIDVTAFPSALALETELTRRLTVIGTVAANAPYIGLLGTVFGIMLTFHTMGTEGNMDVRSIMVGLSLALKATAVGLLVAIPCVAMNNMLRRHVKELLSRYQAGVPHGS